MASFAAIEGAETAPIRDFGRHVFDITVLLRVSIVLYNYRLCVVGTAWFELPTPHPVTEPVSDARVRNEIFRCRGNEAKQANFAAISPAGNRTGWRHNRAGLRLKICPRIHLDRFGAISAARARSPLYLVLTGVYA